MVLKQNIMEIEKGKTYKYLREKREVSHAAKDNLKQFIKIKKSITDALKESDLTIEQLTQELDMPKHEVVFYLMSLVKYGYVQTGAVDDMDSYFSYKLKNNGFD
jgi:DNA-directed RNA polymerase specialized sigma subunit